MDIHWRKYAWISLSWHLEVTVQVFLCTTDPLSFFLYICMHQWVPAEVFKQRPDEQIGMQSVLVLLCLWERDSIGGVNSGICLGLSSLFKCFHGDPGILQKPCCKLKPLPQNGPLSLYHYLTHCTYLYSIYTWISIVVLCVFYLKCEMLE